ncbi:MAG: aminotransferase class I/II-fold pyridoxal phosphate-dependent enzyme [Streptosporangiaceae bacterium]
MLDLTSSLYLGLGHNISNGPSRMPLTTGVPAALAEAPGAATVADALAGLIGLTSATLAPSTLHAFWDLFPVMGAGTIYVDAGTYPIGRWGAERARCGGASVRTFGHHDPAGLRRAVTSDGGHRPVILTDGMCPGCGRVAPVGDYLAVADRFAGSVVVDDTQALGVLGTPARGHPYGIDGGGTARWAGLSGPRLVIVASLAKGFGVPVAVVAGRRPVVRRYEARAETRVHCSPPSNAHLSAAAQALACNASRGDELRDHLARLVTRFRTLLGRRGVRLTPGLFPVQTIRTPPEHDVRAVHRHLGELGVGAVLHTPRCGQGLALSFIITAAHREGDIDRAVRAISTALHPRATPGDKAARRPVITR